MASLLGLGTCPLASPRSSTSRVQVGLSPRQRVTHVVHSGREPRVVPPATTAIEIPAPAPANDTFSKEAAKAAARADARPSTPASSPSSDSSASLKMPQPQGPHSVLALPVQPGYAPGPGAPPPTAPVREVPSYTLHSLPLCSVADVQSLLRACEVPEYALRALKEQGVAGCDLLTLRPEDLAEDPRFKLPPVLVRKVLRVPSAWRLICMLCGSDIRLVLDRESFAAALERAGLPEPSPSGVNGSLSGVARCLVAFKSLDTDGDGVLTLEELSRTVTFLAQVVLEELEASAASGGATVQDPALRSRLHVFLKDVVATGGCSSPSGAQGQGLLAAPSSPSSWLALPSLAAAAAATAGAAGAPAEVAGPAQGQQQQQQLERMNSSSSFVSSASSYNNGDGAPVEAGLSRASSPAPGQQAQWPGKQQNGSMLPHETALVMTSTAATMLSVVVTLSTLLTLTHL